VAKGEHERAAALAQSVAGQAAGDGQLLYLAATVLSLDAAAVAGTERLPAPQRERLTEEYAARAVATLRQAQQAGFFQTPSVCASLETDEDLAFLRRRDDFKQLLAAAKAGPVAGR
jgi:hypothetical protein